MPQQQKIIVAITGASGHCYLPPVLELLAAQGVEIHAIISDAGRLVLGHELGVAPEQLPHVHSWHNVADLTAPMASGSAAFDAMLVVPCSMGSLAAIAGGLSMNLIHRAADVILKERRPLVLAVRETPLNRTHLQNMLTVHDAGGIICPAMPAFYHRPETIAELARQYAGRLCEQAGVAVPGLKRWQERDNA